MIDESRGVILPASREQTLLATLGTEPQVVTATIDLLAWRGMRPGRVVVVHTSSTRPDLQEALRTLKDELNMLHGAGGPAPVFCALHDARARPLEDIDSPGAIESAFKAIYGLVRAEKLEGRRVHFCISGGRKPLALLAMTAAQMLFDDGDRMWYLVSGGQFLASRSLHPQRGDEAALAEMPLVLWDKSLPAVGEIRSIGDPYTALEKIRELQLAEKLDQARSFVLGALSPAERRVVEALVRDGLGDQEIGARLGISPRTVEQHLRAAYGLAANHWELEQVGRGQLISLLNLYFALQLRENPHDSGHGNG